MQIAAKKNPETLAQGFALTDKQFGVIAALAEEKFGLSLPLSKKPLVLSRLSKRLRVLGLAQFDDYLELLGAPHEGPEEVNKLLSSLTTNVTHFFRERHHFDTLRNEVLPALIQRARNGGRVRLWSAGCSSGQEAYCMAMTVLEACPTAHSLDIKILATDVDPQILSRAVEGRYKADQMMGQDEPLFQKYFDDGGNGERLANGQLRKLIFFGLINLIDEWPVRGPFDVIFCRNVAIYFEKDTQAVLWNRFSSKMQPGGYLFIGHSERIGDPATHGFSPVGVTSYRRNGGS